MRLSTMPVMSARQMSQHQLPPELRARERLLAELRTVARRQDQARADADSAEIEAAVAARHEQELLMRQVYAEGQAVIDKIGPDPAADLHRAALSAAIGAWDWKGRSA